VDRFVITNEIDVYSHVNSLIELIEGQIFKVTGLEIATSSIHLDRVNECAGANRVDVVAGTKGVGDITSLEVVNLSEIELDIIAPSVQFVLNCASENLFFEIPSNDTGSYASRHTNWAGDKAGDPGDLPDSLCDPADSPCDFSQVKFPGFAGHQFNIVLAELEWGGENGGDSNGGDDESFGEMDHCDCEELSVNEETVVDEASRSTRD
jgi:hypothetical protein